VDATLRRQPRIDLQTAQAARLDDPVVGSTAYPFSYTYDISGALATETYPSGRVVTNAFDAVGRIGGVTKHGDDQQLRCTRTALA